MRRHSGSLSCAYTRRVETGFVVVVAVGALTTLIWWATIKRQRPQPAAAKKNYCIFCGPTDNKITKEHVWPIWISELFKLAAGGRFTTQRFKDGKTVEKQWTAGEISIQAKALCDYCNNIWLGSEFEGAIIKPLLSTAIAQGTHATFRAEQQGFIAAWAYKMALVLEFATPGKEIFFTEAESSPSGRRGRRIRSLSSVSPRMTSRTMVSSEPAIPTLRSIRSPRDSDAAVPWS